MYQDRAQPLKMAYTARSECITAALLLRVQFYGDM